jgi:hypothetical protein
MPSMEIPIIIGLCLWAIALEYRLRRRDEDVRALSIAIYAVGEGSYRVKLKNNRVVFEPANRGE